MSLGELARSVLNKTESASGRFGIWHITDTLGEKGFACTGSANERRRYSRLYLQSNTTRRRFQLSGAQLSCAGLRQTRSISARLLELSKTFGLSVLSDSSLDGSLAPYLLRVPRYVALGIDLTESEDELLQGLPKDRRRLINRFSTNSFHAKIEHGGAFAREFRDRYHAPSMHRSHGEEASIYSTREIRGLLRNPNAEMIQLFRDDQCIAAGLSEQVGEEYRLYKTGWLDGSQTLRDEGIQAFRVWSAIRRARELGSQRLDLGGTPPFLLDGVFNYKMRWNACLNTKRLDWGMHHLLFDPTHPEVQAFFSRQPMIIVDRQGEFGICSNTHPKLHGIRPNILRSFKSRWRLVSPVEAADRRLPLEPTDRMPSGWFVEAPID
jgi:hypothetical protein